MLWIICHLNRNKTILLDVESMQASSQDFIWTEADKIEIFASWPGRKSFIMSSLKNSDDQLLVDDHYNWWSFYYLSYFLRYVKPARKIFSLKNSYDPLLVVDHKILLVPLLLYSLYFSFHNRTYIFQQLPKTIGYLLFSPRQAAFQPSHAYID